MPAIQAVDAGDRIAQSQLDFDPIVTGLVVGKPMRRNHLGAMLFREIPATALQVRVASMGDEHRIVRDAERALRAAYQTSDRDVEAALKRLHRHSWATIADVEELANAQSIMSQFGQQLPLQTREVKSRLAQLVVEMSMEQRRAETALAAASYSAATPDLDVTLAGGSEWDDGTGGDSRADVRALAATLAAANSVTIQDIIVYLSSESFQAAESDPTYIAKLSGTVVNPDGAARLATYWGVGGVVVGDAFAFDPDTGAYSSLYGDVAILRVDPAIGAQYDTEFGAGDSFVRFTHRGVAMQPWVERKTTTWYFPWDGWELADQVDTTAAAIIRNCAA